MENILNITNGDSAVKIMQAAEVPGTFLPWRDVLHDGPIPAGLSLTELSEIRTQFIFEQGWGESEAIKQSFTQRDALLKTYQSYKKVILWFEHDLYDQLQILQVLDWFSQQPAEKTLLSIICTDRYLGMLSPPEVKNLYEHEQPITAEQLILAKRSWAALRSATPEKWCDLLKTDTSALPFLRGAIIRLLEEYPNCRCGLSRTAQQALKIITQGIKQPGKVFALYQATEERRYLGDASFWIILQEFLDADPALLRVSTGKRLTAPPSPDQELTITPIGKDVAAGRKNWLEISEPDRWIGGVHLTEDNLWCWDSSSGALKKRV